MSDRQKLGGVTSPSPAVTPPALVPRRTSGRSPFESASEVGLIDAVAISFVTDVVANVCVALGASAAACAPLEMNTSAAAGAGTVTVHALVVWSHVTVLTTSVPRRRPSDEKRAPNV